MAMPKFNKPEGMLDSIKSKARDSPMAAITTIAAARTTTITISGDYDDYDDDYEEDDAAPLARTTIRTIRSPRVPRAAIMPVRRSARAGIARPSSSPSTTCARTPRARQPEPRPAAAA